MAYTPFPGSCADQLLTVLRRAGGKLETRDLARRAGLKCEAVHNNLATAVKHGVVERCRQSGQIWWAIVEPRPAPAPAEITPQVWNAWLRGPAVPAPAAAEPEAEPAQVPAEPSNRPATGTEAEQTTQPTQAPAAARGGRARGRRFSLTRAGMLTIDCPVAGFAVLPPQVTAELIRFLIKSAPKVDRAFADQVLP